MPHTLRIPDFFIVGAQRCGTTTLYENLRLHPDVFMSAHKETHYYSQDRVSVAPDLGIRDEAAYLNLFSRAPAAALCGEASPSYLWHPDVASRIHAQQPNAKIIAILRNPTKRAYSQYQMDLADGLPAIRFFDLIVREYHQGEKVYGTGHLYVELGMYAAQLKRYINVFGPERVLVLMTSELNKHPVRLFKRIAAFLEIDPEPFGKIDVARVYNQLRMPRFQSLRRALALSSMRRAYRHLMPANVRRAIRGQLFVPPPVSEIDPRAVEFLDEIYEQDLVELETLCGISLLQAGAS